MTNQGDRLAAVLADRYRTMMIAVLNDWPEFDSLHSDPRFAALGRRLGSPGSR